MSEYREFENGVADILSSIVGSDATVSRNAHLPSRSSKTSRQIDVLVEGKVLGITDAKMIVDCKHWRSNLDISDIDGFIGTVEDVGADLGMIVTSSNASSNARARAKLARGVRVAALSIDNLAKWRPKGTVTRRVRFNSQNKSKAVNALRNAGFRVYVSHDGDKNGPLIEVYRHYGTSNPTDGDLEQQRYSINNILADYDIHFKDISFGTVIEGGTPMHRWIQIQAGGMPVVRTLASNEQEVLENMEKISKTTGIPLDKLDYIRPEGWPFDSPFK